MKKLMISATLLCLGALTGFAVAAAAPPDPPRLVQLGLSIEPTVQAAVVTHVFNEDHNGKAQCVGLVNLTVFPDGSLPMPQTSVFVFVDEHAARNHLAGVMAHGFPAPLVAFWPPDEHRQIQPAAV